MKSFWKLLEVAVDGHRRRAQHAHCEVVREALQNLQEVHALRVAS